MPSQVPSIGSLHSVLGVRPFSLLSTNACNNYSNRFPYVSDLHLWIYGFDKIEKGLIGVFSEWDVKVFESSQYYDCLSLSCSVEADKIDITYSSLNVTLQFQIIIIWCAVVAPIIVLCQVAGWLYLNLFRHTSIAFQIPTTTMHRRWIGPIIMCFTRSS